MSTVNVHSRYREAIFRLARSVLMAAASGGWMDGVKVALGNS